MTVVTSIFIRVRKYSPEIDTRLYEANSGEPGMFAPRNREEPFAYFSLGGGDVTRDTARIARGLLEEKSLEKVDAVIAANTEGRDELRAIAEQFPGRLTITSDARDLAIRITKSHLLVTGGGTPLWKRLASESRRLFSHGSSVMR